MKNIMKFSLKAMVPMLLLSSLANASFSSGLFKVRPSRACDLQENTIEKIQLTSTQLTMDLYMGDQSGTDSDFSNMLTAKLGDVIVRPTPDIVKLGYTSVDRQIAKVDISKGQFELKEYLYDMNLSDDEGLKTGFSKSITLKTSSTGVTYQKTYSDGEVYNCDLIQL